MKTDHSILQLVPGFFYHSDSYRNAFFEGHKKGMLSIVRN